MKSLKTILILIICCIICSSAAFSQEISGTTKIAPAPYIKEGITYEDDMYGSVDYKFYKINITAPKKVILEFDIEAGSVNQGIEYQFISSRANGFETIEVNRFFSNERTDTFFEDSFDIDTTDEYLLKIEEYNNRFLGNYEFKITYDCSDEAPEAKNTSYECVNEQWVLKESAKPKVEEEPAEESQEDICQGCLLNETCYDIGTIQNGTYCSNSSQFLNQKEGGNICEFDYECQIGECRNNECKKQGFFSRILEILKNLF